MVKRKKKSVKWEVHVHRDKKYLEFGWEISVIKSDNTHGRHSYGWDGPDKMITSSFNGVDYQDEKVGKRIKYEFEYDECTKEEIQLMYDEAIWLAGVICDARNTRPITPTGRF